MSPGRLAFRVRTYRSHNHNIRRTTLEIRPEVPKESLQFHMTPEQASVYTAFAESDQEGITLHHAELTSELAELGFVAGLPDVGHLALQVLPGSYSVEGKTWRRITDHGKAPMDNPLYPALKAALKVKNMIWETLKHRVFVRGVVVLPDMSPDSDLPAQVDDDLIWVVCGSENVVERLMDLARYDQDLTRSPAEVMREEMAALTRATGPAGPGQTAVEVAAGQVIIYAQTVNVYSVPPATQHG